ncbi:hypothetical protein TNCV_2334061 [Trichonephila clavipes]|nr:hypothetical protein TNCV_2334061 [Trichonephila clavipes]
MIATGTFGYPLLNIVSAAAKAIDTLVISLSHYLMYAWNRKTTMVGKKTRGPEERLRTWIPNREKKKRFALTRRLPVTDLVILKHGQVTTSNPHHACGHSSRWVMVANRGWYCRDTSSKYKATKSRPVKRQMHLKSFEARSSVCVCVHRWLAYLHCESLSSELSREDIFLGDFDRKVLYKSFLIELMTEIGKSVDIYIDVSPTNTALWKSLLFWPH